MSFAMRELADRIIADNELTSDDLAELIAALFSVYLSQVNDGQR